MKNVTNTATPVPATQVYQLLQITLSLLFWPKKELKAEIEIKITDLYGLINKTNKRLFLNAYNGHRL